MKKSERVFLWAILPKMDNKRPFIEFIHIFQSLKCFLRPKSTVEVVCDENTDRMFPKPLICVFPVFFSYSNALVFEYIPCRCLCIQFKPMGVRFDSQQTRKKKRRLSPFSAHSTSLHPPPKTQRFAGKWTYSLTFLHGRCLYTHV